MTKRKIDVFALGCSKCRLMEVAAHAAVEEMGIDAEINKLNDPLEMREKGVMAQPALFIDGQLKAVGRVPSIDEIKEMLKKAEESKK